MITDVIFKKKLHTLSINFFLKYLLELAIIKQRFKFGLHQYKIDFMSLTSNYFNFVQVDLT